MVMENKTQVDAILARIRSETGVDSWEPIQGLVALTNVEVNINDGRRSANFLPGSGVPVKAFLNTQTGEIKLYTYEAVL